MTLAIIEEISPKIGELFPQTEDADKYRCAIYLALRDPAFNPNPVGAKEVAEHFGYAHVNSLYRRVSEWRRNGTMREVRSVLLDLLFEEIDIARAYVLHKTPEIYKALVEIATEAKSDRNRIDAARFLQEHIIGPAQERGQGDDGGLSLFINSGKGFDPADV